MKTLFYILTGFHAIIHCFGFLKAYSIVEFEAITQPISKTSGAFWLLTFLLLTTTLILNIWGVKYWWIVGIGAVLLSQALIISVWQDARFGTIPNLIILFVCFLSFSDQNFSQMLEQERMNILASQRKFQEKNRISDMPNPIQNWLHKAGVTDSMDISNAYMRQAAKLKMKPEQDSWYAATAEQFVSTNPPSFNWSVRLNMTPFLPVRGRDKFENGKGEMLIKLLSVFPVVNARQDEKIDQGTLQRFLAEIVWIPSAALNTYIQWEAIDEHSAKATMTYGGTSGSGVFQFDEEGNFKRFSAMRYRGGGDDAELTEWIVEATGYSEINGFVIPTDLKASWILEQKPWTWLILKIIDIKYNIKDLSLMDREE